jgi:asparagine synthase (glutamine-hydrolysing)
MVATWFATEMCGINGIFAYHSAAAPVNRGELVRTRDHMIARGPDGSGEWFSPDGRVGFGHRRLSIIDLTEAGAQPMANADGALVVTFNGEVYNYRELRERLVAKGYVFQSNSDTEVLLHLYASMGEAMVDELRGMFAFAIWDSVRRRLFLARDAYGIKPLYYADDGRVFRFASQVKALLAGGSVSDEADPGGLVGFQMFGSVPEPWTTYRAIRALPAGHTMLVSADGPAWPRRYHSIAAVYAKAESQQMARTSGKARLVAARDALLDSVRCHLVADVAVGAFLSAGIDSGALVGLMRDAGQNDIETVTISFKEFEGGTNDEAPIAAEVARRYGTRHTTRVVTRAEFDADLPRIFAAMDQPSIDGINTWFVSKAAHELGLKVAISGVGGDELLGGYSNFQAIPRWVRWLQIPSAVPGLGAFARRIAVAVGPQRLGLSPKLADLLALGGSYPGAWFLRRGLYMPWELNGVLDPAVVKEGLATLEPLAVVRAALDPTPSSAFARVATMEAALYMRNQLLRDTDWASMAHSLEVRTPLVDATLLEQIAALGSPKAGVPPKYELASAPSVPLPRSVVQRKKTGFLTPLSRWMPAAAPAAAHVSNHGYARHWANHVAHHQPALTAPKPLEV